MGITFSWSGRNDGPWEEKIKELPHCEYFNTCIDCLIHDNPDNKRNWNWPLYDGKYTKTAEGLLGGIWPGWYNMALTTPWDPLVKPASVQRLECNITLQPFANKVSFGIPPALLAVRSLPLSGLLSDLMAATGTFISFNLLTLKALQDLFVAQILMASFSKHFISVSLVQEFVIF